MEDLTEVLWEHELKSEQRHHSDIKETQGMGLESRSFYGQRSGANEQPETQAEVRATKPGENPWMSCPRSLCKVSCCCSNNDHKLRATTRCLAALEQSHLGLPSGVGRLSSFLEAPSSTWPFPRFKKLPSFLGPRPPSPSSKTAASDICQESLLMPTWDPCPLGISHSGYLPNPSQHP